MTKLRCLLVTLVVLIGTLSLVSAAQAAPYKGLWLTTSELASASTSGLPTSTCAIDLKNQDSNCDVQTLGAAILAAKTGNTTLAASVRSTIMSSIGTENSGRSLALGRNLGAVVLAADLVNLNATSDKAAFDAWLSTIATKALGGSDGPPSLKACADQRPNNWGTWCRFSWTAVAQYQGNTADLNHLTAISLGYLGDRSKYTGYSYGDLSWQANTAAPVGINPKGAVKNGVNIDGVLPDDQRRGGGCCTLTKENYVHEALQGVVGQAYLFGHNSTVNLWDAVDVAIKRAVDHSYDVVNFPFAGDDAPITPIFNRAYGASRTSSTGTVGKGYGYTATALGNPRLGLIGTPPPPPPADTDSDGVPDSSDQCPTQAGPAPSGCPAPPANTPPGAPQNFTVSNIEQHRATFSWSPATDAEDGTLDGESGYQLHAEPPNGYTEVVWAQDSPFRTGEELDCGTNWTFTMRAIDSEGALGAPASVSFTTLACTPDPQPDTDGDGVTDDVDQCPTTPGAAPSGCPAPPPPADTDGDGVPDSSDQCPTQVGVSPSGCPAPPPPTGGVTTLGAMEDWMIETGVKTEGNVMYLDGDPKRSVLTRFAIPSSACTNPTSVTLSFVVAVGSSAQANEVRLNSETGAVVGTWKLGGVTNDGTRIPSQALTGITLTPGGSITLVTTRTPTSRIDVYSREALGGKEPQLRYVC
jgi:hypothetical protein